MNDRLVDASVIADMLGVKESWVRARARADDIPNVKLGRYTRFDKERVREWALKGD